MIGELAARLAQLPPLDAANGRKDAVACKICAAPARFFDVVDFNKHCSHDETCSFGPSGIHVVYRRCERCGFVFTNFFDDWAAEEFSQFVYNADYIKVDPEYAAIRPVAEARSLAGALRGCERARMLDYGSGSGAFAAEMGAAGFAQVENFDPFSTPPRPAGRFDLITCFEVIEHTTSPLAALSDMKSMLAEGGCIVFSQTLQPPDIRQLRGSWWYLAPRNGHASAFTAESLSTLAEKAGLVFYLGTGPYAFAFPRASEPASRALAHMRLPFFARFLGAPGADAADDSRTAEQWNQSEPFEGGSFRWTGASRVAWRIADLPCYPCTLRVRIRVVHEIQPGFAAASHIVIRGETAAAMLEGHDLVADIVLREPGASDIVLVTPPPVSPAEIGPSSDNRRLGLGIATAEQDLLPL